MRTVVMRHAARSGLRFWWTITVALVPGKGNLGGSGLTMTISSGKLGSARSSQMNRVVLSQS